MFIIENEENSFSLGFRMFFIVFDNANTCASMRSKYTIHTWSKYTTPHCSLLFRSPLHCPLNRSLKSQIVGKAKLFVQSAKRNRSWHFFRSLRTVNFPKATVLRFKRMSQSQRLTRPAPSLTLCLKVWATPRMSKLTTF